MFLSNPYIAFTLSIGKYVWMQNEVLSNVIIIIVKH
jgi:hypothetical protein